MCYFVSKSIIDIIKGMGDNRYNPLGNAKIEEAIVTSVRCVTLFQNQ